MNVYQHPVTLTYVQFGMVAFFAYFSTIFKVIPNTKIRPPTKDIIATSAPLALFQIAGHVFSSIALSRVTVSFAHTIKVRIDQSPLFFLAD